MPPDSQRHLEEPAFLGRKFEPEGDPYRHLPRDRSTGSLVFLGLVLLIGAVSYAGEKAWFLAIPFLLGLIACSVAIVRRVRRLVRDEMDADPADIKDLLSSRRR
ncbi:MAG: hypothetical protein ACR2MY_07585 [Candidatus Dormibacteria bacterium]